MAPEVGPEVVGQVSTTVQTASNLVESFYDMIVKRMEAKNESAPAREIAKRIMKGEGLFEITCASDVAEEFIQDLQEKKIPYLRTRSQNGEAGVLVLEKNTEMIAELKKNFLIQKSNFFREVSLNELETSIVKTNAKDNELLHFEGLDEVEAQVLKEQCGRVGYGFTIAMDEKTDGTHMLSCQSGKVITPPDKADVCLAYTEMAISLYGNSSHHKRMQARRELAFQELVEDNFESTGGVAAADVWILGENEDKQYIKINEHGYEYGECVVDGDHIIFDAKEKMATSYADYEAHLQARLGRIANKFHTYDVGEAVAHFQGRASALEETNDIQRRTELAEKQIAKEVHALAEQNMKKDGPVEEQFISYRDEAVEILRALDDRKYKSRYTDAEIDKIRAIMTEAGVDDLSFDRAIKRLEEAKVKTRTINERTLTRRDIDRKLSDIKPDKRKGENER